MNKIVRVRWLDIVEKTVCIDHRIKPAFCVSYGELVEDDNFAVTIITERSDDDITKQVFPKGCIVSIEELLEREWSHDAH